MSNYFLKALICYLDAQLRAQLEAASLEAAGLQSETAAAAGGSQQQEEAVAAIQQELANDVASIEAADAALNELATDQALNEIAAEMAVNEIGKANFVFFCWCLKLVFFIFEIFKFQIILALLERCAIHLTLNINL